MSFRRWFMIALTWIKYISTVVSFWILALPETVPSFYQSNSYQIWHFTYFNVVANVVTLVLYFSGDKRFKIRGIDACVLAYSAVGSVGLSPINLGSLTGVQQGVLGLAMLFGDTTLIHIRVVKLKLKQVRSELVSAVGPERQKLLLRESALEICVWRFVLYPIVTMLLAWITLALWIVYGPLNGAEILRTTQPGNLNPWWWALFNVVSSFTNCGLDLVNKSMVPFNNDIGVMFNSGVMTMMGKTFWPIMMKINFWIEWRLYAAFARHSKKEQRLRFILDHPRACHPLLLPYKATVVLSLAQIAYNLMGWFFWFLLQWHRPGSVLYDMSAGHGAAVGFFQTIQLRAGGMALVAVGKLRTSLLFIWALSFFFSMYPFMAVNDLQEAMEWREPDARHSNQESGFKSYGSLVRDHMGSQVRREAIFVATCTALILYIENAPNEMFLPIMFEVFSAYSNNGLSMGVKDDDYSLCGSFHLLSKLVLVGAMIRGRHRSLPRTIDTTMHIHGGRSRDSTLRGSSIEEGDENIELAVDERHDEEDAVETTVIAERLENRSTLVTARLLRSMTL